MLYYKPSVIEIHNRPSYLLKISKFFNETNFILVIHNDPLNLRGSTSVEERTKLLKSCYKIYFVSSWVEEKFFTGIDKNFYTNFKTIYPSIDKINNFLKGKNYNFLKLNAAKGFDKFASAITKILKKYKNWKSIVIGDREKNILLNIKTNFHWWIPRKKFYPIIISHQYVVPSLWEEPLEGHL